MSIVLNNFTSLASVFIEPMFLLPTASGQNRLEGNPRRDDFSRSLRAEARDPIWYLTRQWQFGEFKGDDAGSPIDARVKMRKRTLASFAPLNGTFGDMPKDLPLETIVEREVIPFDLVTLRQIASALRRALQSQNVTRANQDKVFGVLRAIFPLDPALVDGVADAAASPQLPLALQNLFDGAAYIETVRDGSHDAQIDAASGLNASTANAAKAAAPMVMDFFDTLYSQPTDRTASSWSPQQLEYQFDCETAAGAKGDRLSAVEYANGRLDWPAFDFTTPRRGSEDPTETEQIESFVPAAVTFGGMPNPRFWMFEDRRVEFADINAGTTDTGKLLLTEFALSYANDWVLIPIETEVGSLCEVEGVVVRDVFGETSLVSAVGQGVDDDWQRWSMFGLSTFERSSDRRLFVPPATPTQIEADPLERVVLLRDEMANMCWGVERIVPSQAGVGRPADTGDVSPPPPPPDGTVAYRLGTEPPLNWVPFSPVHVSGSNRDIRLQRSRLPGPNRGVQGDILDEPSPYFINEEEFPRSGKILTRRFQRCRWYDGRIVHWLGRRVQVGRGEGSSGMSFDQIDV
jgi:hypothetical protein